LQGRIYGSCSIDKSRQHADEFNVIWNNTLLLAEQQEGSNPSISNTSMIEEEKLEGDMRCQKN